MEWWSEELAAGYNGQSLPTQNGDEPGQDGYKRFKDGVYCKPD